MSSSRRRRPRTIQKANLPARIDPAAIYTPQQAVALARQLIANSGAAANLGISSPLPRDPLWAVLPFNPGMPLMPEPINPPNPKTGRPEPRQYDYPVSWNLPGFTDRLVPWSLLRGAADIPLFRQCIETRKNEATTRLWDIRLSKQALQRAQGASPTEAKQDVKRALQEKVEPHIGRLIEFWEMPDRWNGLDIIGWLTKLVEEYFVLDAISIYPRRTRGGDLYGFEILDGSTIKPLLDDSGRRPLPPYPAYQQILQGFPRGEFIADTDLDPEDDPRNLNIPDSYDTDQLIYLPQHVRTFTPYGHSAVERALEDGDLWMQRHNWLKAEYTDGVMPSGWLEAGEGQAQWSPQQLEQYERAFNDYYAGLTKNRMRFRILPYGMKPSQSDDLGEKYKPDYDLFLLKLVAGHFDTTIAELGFTEPGGLGSAGWHEGQADVQERKADRPTLERLGKIITRLSRRFLDMPQELEFKFLAEQDEDENVDDEMWQTRVQSARATINEAREAAGQPRLDMPEADMPMVVSPTGFQFLEGAKDRSDQAAAAALAGPGAEGGPGAEPGAAGEDGTEEGAPAAPGAPDDTGTPQEPIGQIEKAELSKWRAWSKRGRTSRPFEFAHLTKAQFTREVGPPPGNVLFKAAGDPPDPSQAQPGASWPGWAQDLQASQYWTEYLQRALTGGLTAEQLAAELAGALGDAAPSVAQVRDWLATNLQTLIEQGLESVLPQIYVDGWLIGDRSAQAVTSGNPVDWGSWTPGDTRVARALVDQDGTGDGLRRMLDDAGIQIKSIAASQVDRLAQIIASGQETRGTAAIARQIDQALRPTGGRPRAQMIAQTELSRATNTATLTRYNERGVRTVEWHTAPDERVCPVCHANAAQGEIPLGHEFESGVYAPPAHPLCRCALLPGALTKALWDESKHPRGAGGKFGQTTAQDKQQLATANSLAAQGRAIGAKRAAAAKKAARGKKTPMKLPVGMYGYDPKAGKGSKGKKIQDLQLALNKLGVRDAHGRPLTADGSFTPEMVQAVMAIQKRLGWPQTGMVDSKFMTMVIGLDKLPPKDLTSPMMPPLSAAAQRKAAAAAKKAAADHAVAQAETAQGSGTAANLKDALNKADWAGHPALAFILQAELLKAWEAALHPRDEKGRFISVGVRRPRDWRKRAKAVKPGLSAADEFVKDSKVKHDLYHVTRYTGKMGIGEGENGALLGTGFYMHTRKEDSDRYLQGIHDFVASDARQLTMRADVRNPFEFTLKEGKHYDTPAEGLLEAMKERGLAPKDWTAAPPPGSYLPRKPGAKTPDELQDMLAMKGYDSILLHEPNYTDEVGGSQLVAFLNSQIRVTHDPLGQADSGFEKERTAQIEKAAVEQAKRDARNTRRREQRAAKKAAEQAKTQQEHRVWEPPKQEEPHNDPGYREGDSVKVLYQNQARAGVVQDYKLNGSVQVRFTDVSGKEQTQWFLPNKIVREQHAASNVARWQADASVPARQWVEEGEPLAERMHQEASDRHLRLVGQMARGDAVSQEALDSALADMKMWDERRGNPNWMKRPKVAKLATKTNPDRPLAVYGDMLRIDDHRRTAEELKNLEQVPAEHHQVIAEHMVQTADGGIYIGEKPVAEQDHASDLNDEAPRGWSQGSTWDQVGGVHRVVARQILISVGSQARSGSTNTAAHEAGHALDAALNHSSRNDRFTQLHKRVITGNDRINPYYTQQGGAGRQELFAEGHSVWAEYRSEPMQERVFQMRMAFKVDKETATELVRFYDDLLERIRQGKRVI